MSKILVRPEDVWDYCMENVDITQYVPLTIAQDDITGTDVEICWYGNEGSAIVEVNGRTVCDRSFSTPEEAYDVVNDIYKSYLMDGSEENIAGLLAEIDYREGELYEAIYNMLCTVAPEIEEMHTISECEEIQGRITNVVCEVLFKEFGISVYRPMFLENNEGDEFYVEYPYGEMEYDD